MMRWWPLLACSALTLPGIAIAQTTDSGPSQDRAQTTEGHPNAGAAPTEVIVTARRREERLSDVPAAATVLSGDSIGDRGGAVTPVELLGGQASVRILDTGSPMINEISMRGSPTTRGTSGDPSVGLFRDQGYIGGGGFSGRSFARIDMFDIGRVEVLRGTQGALYGRNAVGGAVNIVSARPEFQNSGYVTAQYAFGNEQRQVQAVANVMLSDEVAARVGVDYVRQSDGFFHNDFLGKVLDRNDSTGFRGQLRWRHNDTDIVLRGEHWAGYVPAIVFRVYIDPPRAGFPKGYIQPERTYPWSTDAFSHQEVNSGLLDIVHHFEFATLHSITQYRQRKADFALDVDGVNAALLAQLRAAGTVTSAIDPGQGQVGSEDVRTLTQDVNLTGKLLGDRLDWLVGVEYFQLRSDSSQQALRTPTPANQSPGTIQRGTTSFDSWAAYGSLDFALTEQLHVIGEIRQTWDDKSAVSNRFDLATGLPSGGPGFVVNAATSPDNLSYNGTLAWQPRQGLTLYAKVGSSYRAGGFNGNLGVANQPVPIPATYDDETSTSFELGLRGRLGRTTTFSLATYQTNADNIIVSLSNGCFIGSPVCSSQGIFFAANAGQARTRGAEAELNSRLRVGAGTLTLSGSLSYQKGRVTDGPFDGQLLPQIPRWTFGVDATMRQPLGNGVTLLVNANYNGQRGGIHDLVLPGSPAPFDMDRIDVADARVMVQWSGFEAGLFVTNLTDETYDVYRGASARRLNPPRNWGVQLGYRW